MKPVEVFEEVQTELMARVCKGVYAVLATVDSLNQPRQRIMHPVWDGPTAWMITRLGSLKTRHLRGNPAVSLAYPQPFEQPVYIIGMAEWIETEEEKQRIWDLHKNTPPPVGSDPQPYYGSIQHPDFGLLRLTPARIELADLGGEGLVWRNATS